MPTVLCVAGYRLFFFRNERGEPANIRVEQGERFAKSWLEGATLASSRGFRSGERAELRLLVIEHRALLQERWNERFGRST